MKIKIIMMALVGVVLASCQNDDVVVDNNNFPEDGVIRVTTEVAQTRAGVTTDNLTEFGLTVANAASTTYSYSNVKMTKSVADWNPASQMLWQNATQAVEILAYAPYNSVADGYKTPAALPDQSTEANVMASDFIFMYNSSFVPETALADKKILVTLSHMMAKLDFRIIIGTEFNAEGIPQTNPISEITVNGTKLKGQLKTDNSAVEPQSTDNDATAITPFEASYTPAADALKNCTAEYEVIFVPQTVTANNFTVTFKIGGKEYEWKSASAVTLNSGKKYNLNLTVGKEIVTAGAMSASEWTEGTGGSVETE